MKILVIGSTGFIGSNLLNKLNNTNHEIISYSRSNVENKNNIKADFNTENRWDSILEGVDVCFHLISTTLPKTSNDDPIFDISSNLIATIKLLEAAKNKKIRMVFLSSGGTVYGPSENNPIDENHQTNPICSYGINKLAIEKYIAMYSILNNMESIIFRLSNPYGLGQKTENIQGVISIFIKKILMKETIEIWGDGSTTRDYIYIDDVISVMLKSIDINLKEKLQIYNIGSGLGFSLIELIQKIENISGIKANVKFTEIRSFDVKKNILSIEKIKNDFNWLPVTPIDQGIKITIDSMLRNKI